MVVVELLIVVLVEVKRSVWGIGGVKMWMEGEGKGYLKRNIFHVASFILFANCYNNNVSILSFIIPCNLQV